jgi:hypothetical protein
MENVIVLREVKGEYKKVQLSDLTHNTVEAIVSKLPEKGSPWAEVKDTTPNVQKVGVKPKGSETAKKQPPKTTKKQ